MIGCIKHSRERQEGQKCVNMAQLSQMDSVKKKQGLPKLNKIGILWSLSNRNRYFLDLGSHQRKKSLKVI